MIFIHSFLMLCCLCVSHNWFEGPTQQITCYTGAILYLLLISKIIDAIFRSPSVEVLLQDRQLLQRFFFLSTEFIVFASILTGNFIFLTVRALCPNQVKLIKLDPKKQSPSTDTIESLAVLFAQYQGFVVPFVCSAFVVYTNLNGGGLPISFMG